MNNEYWWQNLGGLGGLGQQQYADQNAQNPGFASAEIRRAANLFKDASDAGWKARVCGRTWMHWVEFLLPDGRRADGQPHPDKQKAVIAAADTIEQYL